MIDKIKFFFKAAYSLVKGMRVTFKNLFAKSVTLNYPIEKAPMTDNFRGMVDLIPEKCVICYQCIRICPTAALDLAHKTNELKKKDITKFTFNAELCCFCGLCDEICPTDAIYMNKLYEVSAFNHDELNNIDLMDLNKYKEYETDQQRMEAMHRQQPAVKPAPAAAPAAATTATTTPPPPPAAGS